MRRLTWIDPSGRQWSFGFGSPVYARTGVQVGGMPAIRTSAIEVPLQPGGRWRHVNHGERDVFVPVDAYAANLEASFDDFVWAVNPTRGDGRLRVTRHDGAERELFCRYIDGLTPTEATANDAGWPAACIFRAVDPYWYDTTIQSVVVAPEPGDAFFPIFPITLGASEATDSVTVVNDGHAQSWPTWTLTGPGSFVAVNTTTDKTLDLASYAVAAGESVVVDTRPGVKTVTSSETGDLFAELSGSLWPLAVGANEITFTVSGGTSDTRLRMSWQRKFLTA